MSTTENNDEIAMPELKTLDSEPMYSRVSGLKPENQCGSDAKSEVAETVLSDSSKSLTGKHELSDDGKEKDESVHDVIAATVDTSTCESATTDVVKTCNPVAADAVETSDPAAVETSDPAAVDVTKTEVGGSADAANLTNLEEATVLVDVLVTTECVLVNNESAKQYKAKEMSMTKDINLEVKADPEEANSELPSTEDGSVAAFKATDSLKMKIPDFVSLATNAGSQESDITPPVTCFNWFKPQRFMSKLRCKRNKSQKSDLPSLTSAVSDPSDFEPEPQPEECGRYYENVYFGFKSAESKDSLLKRIDYASLAEDQIIPAYLGSHSCYDTMPPSEKVIILSVELLVKNAFGALVANDLRAAPLWDASIFDFVGMLTISDFITVVMHYYNSTSEDIQDIENQSIATWRKMMEVKKSFVKVNSTESLVQATKLLIQENVHRLPVFDEKRKSVLFVLTRKRLLHFLSNSLLDNFEKINSNTPSFFRKTIGELKVGTYKDIATVNSNTKVFEALELFVKRNVSSLPVVDKNNVLLDIFEKFDVFQLAKEQTYLDLEVSEAIDKAVVRETAWICTMNETFGTVINRFVDNKVHRIIVIDGKRAVVGIISLSDVLKFLVIDPLENSGLPSTAETIDQASEGAVGGSGACTSLESSHKAASRDGDSSVVTEAVSSLKIDSKVE